MPHRTRCDGTLKMPRFRPGHATLMLYDVIRGTTTHTLFLFSSGNGKAPVVISFVNGISQGDFDDAENYVERTFVETHPVLHNLFGVKKGSQAILLVRPDIYIAFSATAEEINGGELDKFLRGKVTTIYKKAKITTPLWCHLSDWQTTSPPLSRFCEREAHAKGDPGRPFSCISGVELQYGLDNLPSICFRSLKSSRLSSVVSMAAAVMMPPKTNTARMSASGLRGIGTGAEERPDVVVDTMQEPFS
ncbi:hypothetical protein BC938DRAFT_475534 [Jimgerdemannia flammicorona]|uniref:Uncharacterized protein n=1 Tax=Jimgerdemannia flammicorona TaxID=994334 RepID=A0A433PSU8_9FUNG|nr:hypothetical protein BC938DRAFT_475534 [Jimgerdemannia flammicorona]